MGAGGVSDSGSGMKRELGVGGQADRADIKNEQGRAAKDHSRV